MKKFSYRVVLVVLMGLTAVFTSGCGSSSGKTYVDNGPVIPETPTTGNALIVEASDSSTAVMTYTEIGDGSILVTCGDGDDYKCNVSLGELVDEATEEADEAGCEASDGGCGK